MREGQLYTKAGLAQLKESGYKLVHSEFGPPASGKSTRAKAIAAALEKSGGRVVVFDGIVRNGVGGVEVWARRSDK